MAVTPRPSKRRKLSVDAEEISHGPEDHIDPKAPGLKTPERKRASQQQKYGTSSAASPNPTSSSRKTPSNRAARLEEDDTPLGPGSKSKPENTLPRRKGRGSSTANHADAAVEHITQDELEDCTDETSNTPSARKSTRRRQLSHRAQMNGDGRGVSDMKRRDDAPKSRNNDIQGDIAPLRTSPGLDNTVLTSRRKADKQGSTKRVEKATRRGRPARKESAETPERSSRGAQNISERLTTDEADELEQAHEGLMTIDASEDGVDVSMEIPAYEDRSDILATNDAEHHISGNRANQLEKEDWDLELDLDADNRLDISTDMPDRSVPRADGDDEELDPQTALLQAIAISKLTGRRPTPLRHLGPERAKVHALLTGTIAYGEGNSMLLLGSRGTGKTALVNDIIRDFAADPVYADAFHAVRLNGFFQTDDRLALREIWRQLGRDMDLDDDETQSKNYADTLATLLALLSHPSDLAHGTEMEQGRVSKAVVFIMDEFDLFASRPRQTLLYNLFDIAQSRKAPIAVLGLSTKVDVAESLEKRVKSRFSHRYVNLSPAKNMTAFVDICKAAAQIQPDELTFDERTKFSIHTPKRNPTPSVLDTASTPALTAWNDAVEALLSQQPLLSTLTRIYHTTKSIPEALTALHMPLSRLLNATTTTALAAKQPALLPPPASPLHHLPSLSTLALALLVAAARLPLLTSTPTVSFALAYDEYRALASRARLQASLHAAAAGGIGGRVWGRDVARAAWEELAAASLLVPEAVGGGALWRCDVALEEIAPALAAGGASLESGMERWVKEL